MLIAWLRLGAAALRTPSAESNAGSHHPAHRLFCSCPVRMRSSCCRTHVPRSRSPHLTGRPRPSRPTRAGSIPGSISAWDRRPSRAGRQRGEMARLPRPRGDAAVSRRPQRGRCLRPVAEQRPDRAGAPALQDAHHRLPRHAENRARIDAIRAAWKQMTGDQSVLRVTEPADVSF